MRENIHGGHIKRQSGTTGSGTGDVIDFSANINPCGFPDWVRPVINSAIGSCAHYPDPAGRNMKRIAARYYGVPQERIVVCNGTSELISLLPRACGLSRAVIPVPAYLDYEYWAQQYQMDIDYLFNKPENTFHIDYRALAEKLTNREMVFLGHPNNPDGGLLDYDEVIALVKEFPRTIFVIDEAFGEFVPHFKSFSTSEFNNIIVMHSLTKIFALPGLRMGVGIAPVHLADAIAHLQPFWSVNTLALEVGWHALQDSEFICKSREWITARRHELRNSLSAFPQLSVYSAAANYLLCRICKGVNNPQHFYKALLDRGVAVRNCANYTGLDSTWFRVAVRNRKEQAALINALQRELNPSGDCAHMKAFKKRPACMFVGTSSHAGKSVLTAAMCRILLQDGFDAGCFKAQNMSLNSFVTHDGKEMGRAQVVQAQACRLRPDVRMNPVLLKPKQDDGSEVMLMGKSVGVMKADTYSSYKKKINATVRQAYDSLAAEHEIMVCEGAGSVGEINLKHHDIVNMPMAAYAEAATFLVGDIDRGGVFASFIGILDTMQEWERRMLAGLIVNKFRGDAQLLGSAYSYVERYTKKPVLGTVKYIHSIAIAEEDSVGIDYCSANEETGSTEKVRIGMIQLPHVSNFTDMDALRIEPDTEIVVVTEPFQLDSLDVIIIPGSKNVSADYAFLQAQGFADKLKEVSQNRRKEIVGICGGYQMLGTTVCESGQEPIVTLGLLDIRSEYGDEKTLTRVKGTFMDAQLPVHGYEIHYGYTVFGSNVTPVITSHEASTDGGGRQKGSNCWGCYMHGIFDADEFRRWFIDRARQRKGYAPLHEVCAVYDQDAAIDRVADIMRSSCDIPRMYAAMGLSK